MPLLLFLEDDVVKMVRSVSTIYASQMCKLGKKRLIYLLGLQSPEEKWQFEPRCLYLLPHKTTKMILKGSKGAENCKDKGKGNHSRYFDKILKAGKLMVKYLLI